MQTKEQHVMDQLSKFQLNPTVNESGNSILRKLQIQWHLVPSKTRDLGLAEGNQRPAPPIAQKYEK